MRDVLFAMLQSALTAAAVLGVIYAALTWFGAEWLRGLVKAHFDRSMEDYRFELKAHEQRAKIAEYASIAFFLGGDNPDPEKLRRANQLAWELFLWLPDDAFRALIRGVASDRGIPHLVEALIILRKRFLRADAGTLGPDDFVLHGAGLGKQRHRDGD